MSRSLSAVCYHESSHATVCVRLGVDVRLVSCAPSTSPDGESRAGHVEFANAGPEATIAIALAGRIGEAMYLRRAAPGIDDEDSDIRMARRVAQRIDPRRVGQLLRHGQQQAQRLLREIDVWRIVIAMAWELEVAKRLTGEDVERIAADVLQLSLD